MSQVQLLSQEFHWEWYIKDQHPGENCKGAGKTGKTAQEGKEAYSYQSQIKGALKHKLHHQVCPPQAKGPRQLGSNAQGPGCKGLRSKALAVKRTKPGNGLTKVGKRDPRSPSGASSICQSCPVLSGQDAASWLATTEHSDLFGERWFQNEAMWAEKNMCPHYFPKPEIWMLNFPATVVSLYISFFLLIILYYICWYHFSQCIRIYDRYNLIVQYSLRDKNYFFNLSVF